MKKVCGTGICLGITFLQHNPASCVSERRRKRRGTALPYQLFMTLTEGIAIDESYAFLVVDELTTICENKKVNKKLRG